MFTRGYCTPSVNALWWFVIYFKASRINASTKTTQAEFSLQRLETLPVPAHITQQADAEMMDFWQKADRIKLTEAYRKDALGRSVTVTSFLLWLYRALTALQETLNMLPNQYEVVLKPLSVEQINGLPTYSRLLSETLYMIVQDYPEVTFPIKDEAWWQSVGRKLPGHKESAKRMGFNVVAGRRGSALDRHGVHAVLDPNDLDSADVAQVLVAPIFPETHQVSTNARNNYFEALYYYKVLFSREIKYDNLRTAFYECVLDRHTLNKRLLVVDRFFGNNVEGTNGQKFSRLAGWYEFLAKKRVIPMLPKRVPKTLANIYKATYMCYLLETEIFRPYFLEEFLRQWKTKYSGAKPYLTEIKHLTKLMVHFELRKIPIPGLLPNNSYVRAMKQKDEKAKTATTSIPLNPWFQFVILMFMSKDEGTHIIALYTILNMLTSSRFSEVLSLQYHQIRFRDIEVSPGKIVRVCEFDLYRTKTKVQKMMIPVLGKWDLFNLEKVIKAIRKVIRHPHKSIAQTLLLGELTNKIYNKMLDELWGEYLRHTKVYFPVSDSIIKSHSVRKIAALFYTEFLGLHKDYVRWMFGHSKNSTTLEDVYLKRLPSDVRFEQLVTNPHF